MVLLNNLAIETKEELQTSAREEKPDEPEITIAEIRGKLAEYSQAGFTKEIYTIPESFELKS